MTAATGFASAPTLPDAMTAAGMTIGPTVGAEVDAIAVLATAASAIATAGLATLTAGTGCVPEINEAEGLKIGLGVSLFHMSGYHKFLLRKCVFKVTSLSEEE